MASDMDESEVEAWRKLAADLMWERVDAIIDALSGFDADRYEATKRATPVEGPDPHL